MSPAWRAVSTRWPHIARHLEQTAPCTGITLDESGPVQTLRIFGRRLASAWDPEAEAALQCSHLPASCESLTVFGVGMGYLPQHALTRVSTTGTLEVVVLNVSLLKVLLEALGDWRWLEHPAVTLRLPEECPNWPEHWAVTTPLLQCVDPISEPLRDRIMQALDADHMRAQLSESDALVARNIAGNALTLERDVDVGTLFEPAPISGRTIVVAGAGPTLDDSMARIGELHEDGAWVVAVDAAFAPLMEAGIVPEFAVSLDPLEAVLPFYEIDLAAADDCVLVYFPSVHPRVVEHWPHRRCYAYTSHERFDTLRERFPAAELFASGSVIHPAVDLAVRLGASRVCLAGADFGYPGSHTHAKGSRYTLPVSEQGSGQERQVRDYRGETVISQPNFVSYYRDLEVYINSIPEARCRFFSLSERSARLHGVRTEARAA